MDNRFISNFKHTSTRLSVVLLALVSVILGLIIIIR